jgi:multicomponent Na+:H+ antiporter subunit D
MAAAQLAIVVPLIGSAALAGTTSLKARRAADALALLVAAATAVLCLVVLADSRDGTVVAWFGNWKPRPDGIALGIDVAADQLGAGLAAFSALLTLAALAVSWRMEDTAGHLFQALVMVFLAAAVGFALAGDLFTLFVFFELLSVAGYALAGHLVDRRAPVEGALGFAVTNTAGSVMLLIGVALLYGRTGALNLAQLGVALAHQGTEPAVVLGLALICTGFFVKAAIVPFHFWLADAYAAAPAAVCVLFAGVMSELGIYGVARVM